MGVKVNFVGGGSARKTGSRRRASSLSPDNGLPGPTKLPEEHIHLGGRRPVQGHSLKTGINMGMYWLLLGRYGQQREGGDKMASFVAHIPPPMEGFSISLDVTRGLDGP